MIVFTPLGWVVERDQRASEFVRQFDALIASHIVPLDFNDLKDRNRGMIFLTLYKLLCSRNEKYIPLLRIWKKTEFKKVQAAIQQVISDLTNSNQMTDAEWQVLVKDRARTLIVSSKEPIFLVCKTKRCDRTFIMRDTNPAYYASGRLILPDACPNHEIFDDE